MRKFEQPCLINVYAQWLAKTFVVQGETLVYCHSPLSAINIKNVAHPQRRGNMGVARGTMEEWAGEGGNIGLLSLYCFIFVSLYNS